MNDHTFTTEPVSSNLSDGGGKPGTGIGAKIANAPFFEFTGFESLRALLSIPS